MKSFSAGRLLIVGLPFFEPVIYGYKPLRLVANTVLELPQITISRVGEGFLGSGRAGVRTKNPGRDVRANLRFCRHHSGIGFEDQTSRQQQCRPVFQVPILTPARMMWRDATLDSLKLHLGKAPAGVDKLLRRSLVSKRLTVGGAVCVLFLGRALVHVPFQLVNPARRLCMQIRKYVGDLDAFFSLQHVCVSFHLDKIKSSQAPERDSLLLLKPNLLCSYVIIFGLNIRALSPAAQALFYGAAAGCLVNTLPV